MSDAPERIIAWANSVGGRYWHPDPLARTGLPHTTYIRRDLSDALLREAVAALGKLHHAVCGETGFAQCVRDDSKTLYPWPALDVADHAARATLAKLRAHLEEQK